MLVVVLVLLVVDDHMVLVASVVSTEVEVVDVAAVDVGIATEVIDVLFVLDVTAATTVVVVVVVLVVDEVVGWDDGVVVTEPPNPTESTVVELEPTPTPIPLPCIELLVLCMFAVVIVEETELNCDVAVLV